MSSVSTFPTFTTERVIMELFANHPRLQTAELGVNNQARNPGVFATEFLGIVKQVFGSHLTSQTFDEIDWEFIAAHYWTDEENEAARRHIDTDLDLVDYEGSYT